MVKKKPNKKCSSKEETLPKRVSARIGEKFINEKQPTSKEEILPKRVSSRDGKNLKKKIHMKI